MCAWCDRGIWRVVRGPTGAATSSLRTGAGDRIESTRGFLGRGRGIGNRWLGGLPFRREEGLGRLARVRDPVTIIVAGGVMLLPMVDQGSSRLCDYS